MLDQTLNARRKLSSEDKLLELMRGTIPWHYFYNMGRDVEFKIMHDKAYPYMQGNWMHTFLPYLFDSGANIVESSALPAK